MPLHELMFVESNPIPAKMGLMYKLGLLEDELRLQMTQPFMRIITVR